jgi:type I restriction enzyme M protein
MTWKEKIHQTIQHSTTNNVVQIDLGEGEVKYSNEVKKHESSFKTTDEEYVRAFLMHRLVNELDYKPQFLELEKRFTTGRASENKGENDVLVYDAKGNTHFFIEAKAPDKWDSDQKHIEGQLFNLAKLQHNVKYLVWYTIEQLEDKITDKALIIDFEKYNNYDDWDSAGRPMISGVLVGGYDKPKLTPYIKGGKKDLTRQIFETQITTLTDKLHNYLWGGNSSTDSDIFFALVNIILAKIHDESEKNEGDEYDFQVKGYEGNAETPEKLFERMNDLFKRAKNKKMNETDEIVLAEAKIIEREKFSLNKLVFTVQTLQEFSFLEGRNSVDGKDILGDFFEGITRAKFKQDKGQFFTPMPIVRFMLYALKLDELAIQRLNKDYSLPHIIDPSLGSGTFMIEAMKIITKEVKYKQHEKLGTSDYIVDAFTSFFEPKRKENMWAKDFLWGIEPNPNLGPAAKVSMVLHGDGSTNIFVRDGLLPFRMYESTVTKNSLLQNAKKDKNYEDKEVNEKFDVIISNPPFSVDLDGETKKTLSRNFLFADKKNSENLFIERYYQLLKPKGRLAVVLPESVFDTTENKYIRLFLFKYFHIKAVVSLPQVTFEPHTSTKTSLLFAQKKTATEIAEWQRLWEQYGREWAELNTRVANYIKVYLEGADRKKYPSIADATPEQEREQINRFLKDYRSEEDAALTIIELLEKYKDEIIELSKFDKVIAPIYGYYNLFWVFNEVSKKMDSDLFMAEVENVGYKKTKRGEKPTINDLFDLEYAPQYIDKERIKREHQEQVEFQNLQLCSLQERKNELEEKLPKLQNGAKNRAEKEIEKCLSSMDKIRNKIVEINKMQAQKEAIILKYYNEIKGKWTILPQYYDRTDKELLDHFQNEGILVRWASDDAVLRKNEQIKLLDIIRKEVSWA